VAGESSLEIMNTKQTRKREPRYSAVDVAEYTTYSVRFIRQSHLPTVPFDCIYNLTASPAMPEIVNIYLHRI